MTGRSADAAPQLDLSFRYHPVRGTWLDRRVFRWPFTLSRGFHLNGTRADRLTLILQTVSGAIQAGDRLVQRIHVGPHALAHITTQGATPVYRAAAGMAAEDDIALSVEAGGCLEYLPELRILFPESSLSQRISLRLPTGATAILADGFVMHDPQGDDRPFRHYGSTLMVQRPDGTLLAADRFTLDAPPRGGGKRAQYRAHGTLIVATSRAESCLLDLCAEADARIAPIPGVYATASPLPNGAGVGLRVAAVDGRHLRLALQSGWRTARQHLLDHTPALDQAS